MAEEFIKEVIIFFNQPSLLPAKVIYMLYFDEIKNTFKHLFNLVLERTSSSNWKLEQIEIPINLQNITRHYDDGNGEKNQRLILNGRLVFQREKKRFEQIIGLWKNENWGYITLLDSHGEISYCNITKIDLPNLQLNNIQPFSITLKVLGTSKTHDVGYLISNIKEIPNDWNI